jgi:predicted porin
MGKVSFGQTKDKMAANNLQMTRKTGIGLEYALSKRTQIYTNYGSVKNDSGATTRVSGAPNAYAAHQGTNVTNMVGTNGFDLGIGHNF